MEGAGEDGGLAARAAAGDREALGVILARHRGRLVRMVRLRLDRRLHARVDASDVVQEACLEAAERLPEYARNPSLPLLVWLRFLTAQRLAMVHRRHLGVKARDVARDVPIHGEGRPGVTSEGLADMLAARQTSPSEAAARREMVEKLLESLEALDPIDREVVCLRHFEQLSNAEVASELGLTVSAASKRYIRAFRRLAGLLGGEAGP